MKHFHCPVNDWECPYYKDDCLCTMKNPFEECDDFYGMWGDCDPDDYTDYDEEEEEEP